MVKCEHDSVEQIRGQMGEGDYFDVLANDADEAKLHRVPKPYHENVELDEGNSGDMRIICRKCHLTTGWAKADAPGMPGAGAHWLRHRWAEMTGQE